MDHDFEAVGAGASSTQPIPCGSIKKGGHVMLKGRPCKVVEYSTSKTGKHGHAKASITGIDVFTGRKYEDTCPTSHTMEEPIVTRTQFQLMSVDTSTGFLQIMDSKTGDLREDLKWDESREPKDQLQQWEQALNTSENVVLITVLKWGDEEKVLGASEK